jgi:hypothetical protein
VKVVVMGIYWSMESVVRKQREHRSDRDAT